MVGSPRVVHGRNLENQRDIDIEDGSERHFYGRLVWKLLWKTLGSLSCADICSLGALKISAGSCRRNWFNEFHVYSKILGNPNNIPKYRKFFRHPNHRCSAIQLVNQDGPRDGNETGPNSGRPLPRHCSAVASDSPRCIKVLSKQINVGREHLPHTIFLR